MKDKLAAPSWAADTSILRRGYLHREKVITNAPLIAEVELDFRSPEILRSIAKMAYTMTCSVLPLDWIFTLAFDDIRNYILLNSENRFARANFKDTDFLLDASRPLHTIFVAPDRINGLIIGYVMLFGCYCYTVILARNWLCNKPWPGVEYTFDPSTHSVVPRNQALKAPTLTEQQLLKPAQTRENIRMGIQKGISIIAAHSEIFEGADISEI